MKRQSWIAAAVAGLGLITLSLKPAGPAGVEVGESVSHTFRTEIVNGMGTKTLESLRGKPVLVEFWGTK